MHNLFLSVLSRGVKLKFSVLLGFIQDTMYYYAVAKGRSPGVYMTWDECKAQVHQFPGPVFKKFPSKGEAENFIKQHAGSSSYYSTTGSNYKQSSLFSAQKTYALGKGSTSKATSSKRLLSTEIDSSDEELENIKKKQKTTMSKNKDGYFMDDNGYVEVFTDGACTSNGRGNAKAGVGVWFSDGHELNVSQPVIGRATNNMAEIQAVTVAARQAQKAGIKKLKISTDSQFLIKCITQWMPKWKRTGWKTGNGKPVINKEELIEMEKSLAPLQISWNHVRGHVGIHGNEMADSLAREGSQRYKSK